MVQRLNEFKNTAVEVAGRFTQKHSFCDWVSIYQAHDGGTLPKINDGAVIKIDSHGETICTTLKKFKIEGSHETCIHVRCDGTTVWFEGNVSKFGRQDNVFGFSLQNCIERINALLGTMGLPPFTNGTKTQIRCAGGGDRIGYTGAKITRLDLTANFETGSKENAFAFMRHIASQQASRLKTGTYGEGETVDFGRGSRRVYSKAYLKHAELLRHMKKQSGPDTAYSTPFDPYVKDLADWCASVGLVRFETTYKSTFLIDQHFNFLGSIDMRHLESDFLERQQIFTQATCEIDELSDLEPKSLAIYRMWQAGDDLTTKFKKSAFYKHRSRLLPFGVDIAIKSNVLPFKQKIRVIKLGAAVMPDFYQLPSPTYLRLAA